MAGDARLKIERADKHIHDAEAAVQSLERHYLASIEEHGELGNSIKYECPDFQQRLAEIGLITGDAVHNLRTALDYAWIGIIDALGLPVTRWTKFPFSNTAEELRNVLAQRKIGAPGTRLFETIMTDVKPYRGGDLSLWALHEADIVDKHRLILPVIDYATAGGISVQDENGVLVTGATWGVSGTGGSFRVDLLPNLTIKNKGYVSLEVHFGDGSGLVDLPVPDELFALLRRVRHVVDLLEGLG